MLVGLLAALLASAVGAAPAQADTAADGNTIIGTLLNSAADNAPVEGVEITVTSADGQEYSGTSDAEGKFSIAVPGEGGTVTIELDTESLPEDVELRTDDNTRQVTLLPGQTLPIAFPLGPDTRNVESKWDRVPGLIYSGLLFGGFALLERSVPALRLRVA